MSQFIAIFLPMFFSVVNTTCMHLFPVQLSSIYPMTTEHWQVHKHHFSLHDTIAPNFWACEFPFWFTTVSSAKRSVFRFKDYRNSCLLCTQQAFQYLIIKLMQCDELPVTTGKTHTHMRLHFAR